MGLNKRAIIKSNERGIALLELAVIIPLLCIFVFAIIDFGRLVQARLTITNVSREGGDLASRDIDSGSDLCALLQSSASPLDLNTSGKIYISTIQSGTSAALPDPTVASQYSSGSLTVSSSVGNSIPQLGVSPAMYNHLVYNAGNKTSDISQLTIVEVFYNYQPITPLPNFIQNLIMNSTNGIIISSKAVF